MSQSTKSINEQFPDQNQYQAKPNVSDSKDNISWSQRRNRKQTDGLEIGDTSISDNEFDEVFKQFQHFDEEETKNTDNEPSENIEIYDYQMLYREGVECAYIAILQIEEDPKSQPALYAFRDEEVNADSIDESKPTHVQNIFGNDVYSAYLEQGWKDISKSENDFPWKIKSWLAMNMKQDTINSR